MFHFRQFFLTVAVLVPVGITVIDEVGLPGNISGVSMRVSKYSNHRDVKQLHGN